MGRHVTVNRLEVQQINRSAMNNTFRCQASNTKLVPPAEKNIKIEMLCKYKMLFCIEERASGIDIDTDI